MFTVSSQVKEKPIAISDHSHSLWAIHVTGISKVTFSVGITGISKAKATKGRKPPKQVGGAERLAKDDARGGALDP